MLNWGSNCPPTPPQFPPLTVVNYLVVHPVQEFVRRNNIHIFLTKCNYVTPQLWDFQVNLWLYCIKRSEESNYHVCFNTRNFIFHKFENFSECPVKFTWNGTPRSRRWCPRPSSVGWGHPPPPRCTCAADILE